MTEPLANWLVARLMSQFNKSLNRYRRNGSLEKSILEQGNQEPDLANCWGAKWLERREFNERRGRKQARAPTSSQDHISDTCPGDLG